MVLLSPNFCGAMEMEGVGRGGEGGGGGGGGEGGGGEGGGRGRPGVQQVYGSTRGKDGGGGSGSGKSCFSKPLKKKLYFLNKSGHSCQLNW